MIEETANNGQKKLDLVMLIDDHDISNFMAQQVLINSGIALKSIIKPAGFSAINYLIKSQDVLNEIPDIIFLDLDMPVIDGFEFLKRFAALPQTVIDKCKIVILSAHDKRDEIQQWMDQKVVIYYIMKPLTPLDLDEFKNSTAYINMLKAK